MFWVLHEDFGLIKENIVGFKKMLNIYNCEAQIRFLLIVHPSPAKPNRPSWTKFKIETGFFSLILTPWSQLWIVIFSFSYTVDFRVNL